MSCLANFVFAAFQEMHGHLGLFATLECDLRVAHFFEFIRRKQTHAVDEGEFGHAPF